MSQTDIDAATAVTRFGLGSFEDRDLYPALDLRGSAGIRPLTGLA